MTEEGTGNKGTGGDGSGDDFKVVIIDKFPSYITSYTLFFQYLAHECNPQEYTFVARLAKNGMFVENGQKEFPIIVNGYDKPLISRNGNLMMCINGFKDAVENHMDTIMEFLGC